MSALLRKPILSLFLCLVSLFTLTPSARASDDWLPIAPEELKMTSDPKAPGAPAIYLYRQVDRDDTDSRENTYARIKIFTEEGRKYADVEIPFLKGAANIKNIQARTIHEDGRIIHFDGKIYEKMIVKAKGVKFLARTFTMPDVQVGSIIEYRYTTIRPDGYVFDSRWLLSEDLFTKHARFSLHKSSLFDLRSSWPRGLPEGTNPPVMDKHFVRLETENVPAFQIEDYMPPQEEMKYRVEFTYSRSSETNPDRFWSREAGRLYQEINLFTDQRKLMEQAVSQIVQPTDTPDEKLQKIYARCQKIRNTSFERDKTQQELHREKIKDVHDVGDVWKRGYGEGGEITWLFLALARAAGFEASPVMISTRDKHFFNAALMNSDDLNTNVVQVKFNGEEIYLDPGIAFAPFGLLPWYETGVKGLRLGAEGGTWVTTTLPGSAQSGIERKASLQLDDSGTLEGNASITFKGLDALQRRIDELDEDDAQRKKSLEDEMKGYVPVSAEAELTNSPDWNNSSKTLVAEFHLKVPGWASSAGRRTVLAAEVFGGDEKHLFEGSNRVNPIYIHYPHADVDEVTITPPAGAHVTNLPQPHRASIKACSYNLTAENKDAMLHLSRRLTVELALVDPMFYGTLHKFFQAVRDGDEQQIVLSPETAVSTPQ